MEDSIIINKAAIERGCFNLTYFKNEIVREEENKTEGESIVFNNPYKVIESGKDLKELKYANYKKLDEQGFPILNQYIQENDAYLGKTKIKTEFVEDKSDINNIFGNKTKKEVYSDRTLVADKTLSGLVDKVFIYKNEDQNRTCKIRFRKIKIPEPGDKLCSRNGQKGVIGMIMAPENMPFSKDGIIPDIIINPHAIPSRMIGTTIDATPFNNNNYDEIYDKLESEFKMERYGNEILYNGFTGSQISTEIFIGPTYYERLKHMVSDKINYRNTGYKTIKDANGHQSITKTAPVMAITRQPTSGRGNNGANRVGEMEQAALLSHGTSQMLKESFMDRSDDHAWNIDNYTEFPVKKTIKDAEDISIIKTPYAFKVLVQEIASLSIKTHLITQYELEEDNLEDHAINIIDEEEEEIE